MNKPTRKNNASAQSEPKIRSRRGNTSGGVKIFAAGVKEGAPDSQEGWGKNLRQRERLPSGDL